MNRLVALIGNGVSIAYNPELSVPSLTSGIVARFKQLGGTQAGDALRLAARRIGGTNRSDFEALLGPLDTVAAALDSLRAVAQLSLRASETDMAIKRTSKFLAAMYRLGLSEALALVAARAHGQGEARFQKTAVAFAQALDRLPTESPITVANLSYDGLFQAGALRLKLSMADLADGRIPSTIELNRDRLTTAYPLRSIDDLPSRRLHLLHLHGSIGWLRTSSNELVKCEIEDLREGGFWRRVGTAGSAHTPVVVLTDRKEGAVALEPFALAYRIFGERLAMADHWLIAGYSFGDVPVNRAFQRAIRLRRMLGETDPHVLVIGRGNDDTLKKKAREAGVRSRSLRASALGLPKALEGPRWKAWAAL